MFKIDKLDSTLCNAFGHTKNDDGAGIDWYQHLEDSSIVPIISGVLHQVINPSGTYLGNNKS